MLKDNTQDYLLSQVKIIVMEFFPYVLPALWQNMKGFGKLYVYMFLCWVSTSLLIYVSSPDLATVYF